MGKFRFGQHVLPNINFTGDGFLINNFRDFNRSSEDYHQKSNFISKTIKYEDIKSVWLYIYPFALGNTIAHSMLGFVTKEEEEFCISREAQFLQGKDWNLWDNLVTGYRAIVLRGSANDFIGLRDNIRGEKGYCYRFNIQASNTKKLLLHLGNLTNQTNNKYTNYSLINKNCASGVWNYINKDFSLPKYDYRLIFTKFLPNILLSKSYIYPDCYTVSFDKKNKKVKKILKSNI